MVELRDMYAGTWSLFQIVKNTDKTVHKSFPGFNTLQIGNSSLSGDIRETRLVSAEGSGRSQVSAHRSRGDCIAPQCAQN